MITKERLEELIRQGASVWEAKYGKVKEFNLSTIGDYLMSKEYIRVYFYQPYNFITRKRYDKLFEDKGEAEWFSKFRNITRTEILSLPTWDEFYNSGKMYYFRGFYGNQITLRQYDRNIFVNDDYIGYLTEPNYLEACELCRKMFLGEE